MGSHHGDGVEPEGAEQAEVREHVGDGGGAPSQELGDNPTLFTGEWVNSQQCTRQWTPPPQDGVLCP